MTPLSDHNKKDMFYHKLIAKEYDDVVVAPRIILNDITYSKFCRHIINFTRNSALDLGCGSGHATLRFSEYFDTVLAVDHSSEMLEVAKENIKAAKILNCEFICDDAFSFLEKTSRRFDAIFCIGFIHHLLPSTHTRLLQKLDELLNPGGVLFISEPIKIPKNDIPEKISSWNAAAPVLNYSCQAVEPDEDHVDEDILLRIIRGLNYTVVKKTYHWEIFPHTLNPSFLEKLKMRLLNWKFGATGNVLSILVRKDI
jgi:SAM-dependent methyltransferase